MRLIDAGALMDALGIAVECKDCSRNGTFGCKEDSAFVYACEAVTDAPAIDAVEVVRCKECIHAKEMTQYGCGECVRHCEKLKIVTSPEWYCAEGKRDEQDLP